MDPSPGIPSHIDRGPLQHAFHPSNLSNSGIVSDPDHSETEQIRYNELLGNNPKLTQHECEAWIKTNIKSSDIFIGDSVPFAIANKNGLEALMDYIPKEKITLLSFKNCRFDTRPLDNLFSIFCAKLNLCTSLKTLVFNRCDLTSGQIRMLAASLNFLKNNLVAFSLTTNPILRESRDDTLWKCFTEFFKANQRIDHLDF